MGVIESDHFPASVHSVQYFPPPLGPDSNRGGGNWIQFRFKVCMMYWGWEMVRFNYPPPLFKSTSDSNCVWCTEAGKWLDLITPRCLNLLQIQTVYSNLAQICLAVLNAASLWRPLVSCFSFSSNFRAFTGMPATSPGKKYNLRRSVENVDKWRIRAAGGNIGENCERAWWKCL